MNTQMWNGIGTVNKYDLSWRSSLLPLNFDATLAEIESMIFSKLPARPDSFVVIIPELEGYESETLTIEFDKGVLFAQDGSLAAYVNVATIHEIAIRKIDLEPYSTIYVTYERGLLRVTPLTAGETPADVIGFHMELD